MKKALLIGINYRGTANELRGCINDVYNIRTLLVNKFGYNKDNVKMLCDDSINVKPTRENIQKSITALVEIVKSGDTLILHYSGHGTQIRDSDNDELDMLDEVIVPVDYTKSGVITDDYLISKLRIPKDVKMYVFMDCCHSGTILDLKYNVECEINSDINKSNAEVIYKYLKNDKCKDVEGEIVMISGCLDEQTSSDAFINNKSQGAFTCCLIECLTNKQKEYYLKDLLKDIHSKLIEKNFKQRSQMSLSLNNWENAKFDI